MNENAAENFQVFLLAQRSAVPQSLQANAGIVF
jgi:hypothetical protein